MNKGAEADVKRRVLALLDAAEEGREVLAAAMRCLATGPTHLLDQLRAHVGEMGVTDGFGVRLQNAIRDARADWPRERP